MRAWSSTLFNVWIPLYTVPAGRTLVVRTVSLYRATSTATDVWLDVLANGTGFNSTTWFSRKSASWAADDAVHEESWKCFNPGDALRYYQTARIHVALFGALLSGEPS